MFTRLIRNQIPVAEINSNGVVSVLLFLPVPTLPFDMFLEANKVVYFNGPTVVFSFRLVSPEKRQHQQSNNERELSSS